MNAPIPTLNSWPEQSIRGHSIPGSRYTSRDFMEQEWEGMWTRVWLSWGVSPSYPSPVIGRWSRYRRNPDGAPARWNHQSVL